MRLEEEFFPEEIIELEEIEEYFEPEYEEIRNNFFTNTFTKEDIENLINTWAGQIKDSVQEAAESHKDQPSLRSWLSNLERFKNDLQTVRNNN